MYFIFFISKRLIGRIYVKIVHLFLHTLCIGNVNQMKFGEIWDKLKHKKAKL